MSKYIALEWDEHEVRVAIASQRGASAVLERAFAVALPPATADKPHDAATVAGVLREALAGESLRKAETLAVVGRTSIELKEMSLPPAPDDELPDMVRFQALRDFTQISDDTPLDFISLPGQDAEHRSVLAAAISNELLSTIRSTCEQAGLELSHLVLRPCAAASLLRRQEPAVGQVRMFVDLLGDEVDLTVLDLDTPLLMRTTRLPGDASQPEFCRPVFLEIRRTIAAVQNKLHGRRVEKIWLCGDGASQQTLSDMVKSELDLPTELFDPFTAFEQTGAMRARLPAHHSRFAPLLGMLADAAAGERHAIDFLDPRRRPQAKTRRREAILAGTIAAAVLLLFLGGTWWRLSSLDREIGQLKKRNNALDSEVKQKTPVEKEIDELLAWTSRDVPWLDVLHRLSIEGPKAEEAMLTSLKAEAEKAGGGKITMDVLAASPDEVGNALVKVYPNTKNIGKTDSDTKVARYPWKFKAAATIDEQAIDAAKKQTAKKTAEKPPATGDAKTKQDQSKSASSKADSTRDLNTDAKSDLPAADQKSAETKTDTAATSNDTAQPATATQSATSTPETEAAPSPAPAKSDRTAEKKEG